jgi:phage replication O-like protein O
MEIRPFDKPERNYTILHNTIFDEIMSKCTSAEWKVLCVILRKTRGWQKDSDFISYSQIRELSGIASNSTIQKAIDGLVEKELIILKVGDVVTTNKFQLNKNYTTITETVIPPVTEIVTPPITESVNTKDIPFKEIELTGDLFKDCQHIYEQLKGRDIGAPHSFVQMINNFKKNKVIAKDYYESIIDQDASGKYPRAQSATSYESWTLTHAHNRLHPVTPNNNGHKKDDYPEIDPNSIWVTPDGTEYNAYGEVVGTWKK